MTSKTVRTRDVTRRMSISMSTSTRAHRPAALGASSSTAIAGAHEVRGEYQPGEYLLGRVHAQRFELSATRNFQIKFAQAMLLSTALTP